MTSPLIRRLTLQNFLSYGSEGIAVDLLPLNVLIGPNASGKSNLLEALSILRATASDLQAAVREGGGSSEYLWKGVRPTGGSAYIGSVVNNPNYSDFVLHGLSLRQVGPRLEVENEYIGLDPKDGSEIEPEGIYLFQFGSVKRQTVAGRTLQESKSFEDLKSSQSVLAQRRDPDRYPEITFLADQFGSISLFQEWNFGRRTPARLPQPTDLPSDFLLPDASNLGLILHDLAQTSTGREELIGYLRRFYEPARYISTKLQGGTLQLFIEEEHGRLIPATRLSDGTLRFLCLLAILCHPSPPPVIGIEEPELGLHPDILPTIAELLRKASERTQLFVTTHSDALVSALSDTPESILVCEGTPDGTAMKRLDAEQLKAWLADYSLGELWRMGEIGGNRW
jgi:predicted ATPase